jgi:hypothetical protein
MRTSLAISIGLAAACGSGSGNGNGNGNGSGSGSGRPKDAGGEPTPDAASLPPCPDPVWGMAVRFRRIGDIGPSAVLATAPPLDRRLFVVAQQGTIHVFKDEALVPTPFLDLGADSGGPVTSGGEMGLLGLAFHPRYAANGQFFVFYTTGVASLGTLRDVLARCTVSANPDVASPTCTEVLSIPDFASNHNGGMIEFGGDGFLYIGTGDGGGAGDPSRNAQTVVDGSPLPRSVALLGKILRIDVDRKLPGKEYDIPADNPYAAGGGAPEIFMIGLRNPWRWSFDRATGDLWIADVGQDRIEELTIVPRDQQRGANLGWSQYEGAQCFNAPCSPDGKLMPQLQGRHTDGWSTLIGGQVYRGTCSPDLVGQYFFAEHQRGRYARATFDGVTLTMTELIQDGLPDRPTSLHADARGELYLTTISGEVFRLEATP